MAKKPSVIITRNNKKRGNKKEESSDSESEYSADESTIYTDVTEEDDEQENQTASRSSYEESVGKRRSKRHIIVDSESEQESINESENENSDEDFEQESKKGSKKISEKEMLETLYKLYPSKYMKQKIDDMKNRLEETTISEPNRKFKKQKLNPVKNTKKVESEQDEESESEYITEDETTNTQKKNFNIILTIGNGGAKGATSTNTSQEPSFEDDENEELNTDDEKTFMKENYEKILTPSNRGSDAHQPARPVSTFHNNTAITTPVSIPKNTSLMSLDEFEEIPIKERERERVPIHPEFNKSVSKKSPRASDKAGDKTTKKKQADESDEFPTVDVEEKYKETLELKKVLAEKLRKKPGNSILIKAIQHCNKKIRNMIRKARSENAKTYYNLINVDATGGTDENDEIAYFKKQLSNKEQIQVVKDLKKIHEEILVEKPYRLKILQSQMPAKLKAVVFQKLSLFEMMDPSMDSEYYKMRTWIDTFMRIPFGLYKSLDIKMSDGIEASNNFMINAKQSLDKYVYGLNEAKTQVMQMMGQWIANPGSLGTAIAIHGPPGTAKTTLVKEGISRTLGREFAFIALGGAGDSSFLEGHSYTYEGSMWGRIVQILIDSKCMNPVIYFDELDKVSDTPRGEEIIGILTHLTDTSQNSQFHDKYFNGIDFDLSKCLFIFSYNDESKVNPILKDRMYRIKTQGYSQKEKIVIARKHLLPKIREQVNFSDDDVIIGDDVLSHIIEHQASGEEGVRNLKRTLEIIHTKINLYRLVKNGEDLFEKDAGLGKVEFPYTVTKRDVDRLVKVEECISKSVLNSMYM